MPIQAGSALLLKIKDAAGVYRTVAGLRTKTLRLNARPVDITDSASVGGWKELLPGAGIRTADISGAGVFRDAESDSLARQAFFDQSALDCEFIVPDFGVIRGPFLLTTLSYAGTYQGEANFELSLVSAGAPAFEAV